MRIPFTQYLRPNGRRREITVEMPDHVVLKAQKLLDLGCHFDAEVLTTGVISFTCEKGDDVLSIRLCENGPPVQIAVADLVDDAFSKIEEQTDGSG